MASIVRKKTKTGVRYDIQLSPGENESRPKISLGDVNKKQAGTAKTNIENLIKCKNTGGVISPAVQEWLNGITDGLRKRLEVLSIIEPNNKGQEFTVAEWVDKYIEIRESDKGTKADTVRKLENVARRLSVFFKNDKLKDISVFQAKAFKQYLHNTVGLAENTARKHIAISRQFFTAAIESNLIENNPFKGKGQPVTIRPNPNRFFYVTQEMAEKVLETCPDAQWRLIFGLARWGGLRCPSEVLRLKWQDVDFENNRFTVHASKTERHADAGIRTVPMFPELRPLFQDAFDNAKEGDIYCITRYRDKSVNLRTQLSKIIRRAGLEVWPKLFQNCRSTRETELFKMTGGNIKAVCSWIGNSPAVAMQHYAQVTEADIQEAAKMTLLNDAENIVEKRVHNRVQTTATPGCTESHEAQDEPVLSPCSCKNKQEVATPCEKVQNPQKWAGLDSNQRKLTLMGLQPIPFSHSGTDPIVNSCRSIVLQY